MRILVTGATGYIGGRLVPALLERGHRVRVMAREPLKLTRKVWPGVEVVKGDALDPESLAAPFEDIEVAYYLIHSMTTSGHGFAERDRAAAENFARAASAAGVKRIIYLGGLGRPGPELSEHLKSRHETGAVLRRGAVPVTELRAAIIVGSGSASFTILHDLVRKLPFMICPRWVRSRCEPIAIRQVIGYLVGVLEEPRSIGETLEIGGGEIMTYEEMMRRCARVLGRTLYILNVPVLTPALSSYWLNLVTHVPMSLARPLVEGLRNDVVCNDNRIREWIQVPAISYDEAVRLAVSKTERGEEESIWSDATTVVYAPVEAEHGALLKDERSVQVNAPVETLFGVVERIGGENGWYHADWLWHLRAALDYLLGGIGMRRGRRDTAHLAVGDPVDFWRVERREANQTVGLRAEMMLPGVARLTFETAPREGGSQLVLKAHFWPHGFWGRAYWYAVLPLHDYVFNGMLLGIKRVAEREGRVA
ncbi:MAG: hypothetical protein RL417_551 [Pseudomonadota bacterium]